ncbi:MAG: 6,7-dimethyl-8-ribityllumazine synthase [Pseudomonadota bacterium]
MRENGSGCEGRAPSPFLRSFALGERVVLRPARGRGDRERRKSMTHALYAFVKANWHADVVDRALDGFCQVIPTAQVDVFDVPGAFELPLISRDLAASGRYAAVVAAAFVVDGGIYRHEFVASAVIDGLMRAGLDTGVPVLSVSLTPHQYQSTAHHAAIFRAHFVDKGREAAQAALKITEVRTRLKVA